MCIRDSSRARGRAPRGCPSRPAARSQTPAARDLPRPAGRREFCALRGPRPRAPGLPPEARCA
eukprot:15370763-Alexandrium_andersonii.AAC.1